MIQFGDSRLPERFWRKATETSDCWVWQAAIHRKGYGQFYFRHQMAQAHRVAYEVLVGQIGHGMQLDHTCFNKACVNPAHLNPVSNKQNSENRPGANVTSRSGIRGVLWHRRRELWFAKVSHNGRAHYGGWSKDIRVAERAAVEIRNRLYSNNLVDRAA